MTTIHTFEDILAVLEREPELRDALHRHVLGEEIPELPAAVRQVQDIAINLMQNQAELSATARAAIETTANTLVQFMEQTTLLMANAGERQTAIEDDTAKLREGQIGLTAGVAELRERTTRLESVTTRILDDVVELKTGMVQANERLDSLEAGQAELTAGHAELKAGMVQANERLDSLEAGQAELKAGQAELKAGQAELTAGQAELTAGQVGLTTGQASMQGQLNRLTGSDYERRVVRRLRRSAERRFSLHNATVLHGITVPDNSSVPDLLDAALQGGAITENEANDAELADIIIGGDDGRSNPAYLVIEASITIDRHDIDRAIARAAVISKAANAPATAAVAGTSISDADRQHADDNSVTVIILPD